MTLTLCLQPGRRGRPQGNRGLGPPLGLLMGGSGRICCPEGGGPGVLPSTPPPHPNPSPAPSPPEPTSPKGLSARMQPLLQAPSQRGAYRQPVLTATGSWGPRPRFALRSNSVFSATHGRSAAPSTLRLSNVQHCGRFRGTLQWPGVRRARSVRAASECAQGRDLPPPPALPCQRVTSRRGPLARRAGSTVATGRPVWAAPSGGVQEAAPAGALHH